MNVGRPLFRLAFLAWYTESDKYDGTEGNIASKRMFHEAGVKLVQLPYEIDVETKISVIRN